jgi:RNA polymerase I-specific transcription initiation factor RRN3
MDVPHIQDMVNKLDSVLKLIFEHFSNPERSSSSVRSNSPSTPRASATPETGRTPSPDAISRARATQRAQFLTLLGIFDRTILRTFKSRYTQFLVFWFAARDPAFGDLFQGMLVERALLDARAPPVERAAAAAYLASLVSRAAFVGRAGARAVVRLLCGYLREHLDVADAVVLPAAQHGIFFASAQAVFLIFCFRWRDLGAQVEGDAEGDADADVEADDRPAAGRKWMPELLVLQRAVTSPLNPLKVSLDRRHLPHDRVLT